MKYPFQGIIFDMDGTLLDSMPYWRNMKRLYLTERGVDPSDHDLYVLQTLSLKDNAYFIREHYPAIQESPAEIEADFSKACLSFYTQGIPPKKGLIPFLDAMKERGVPLAIASATAPDLMDLALTASGIRHYFHATVSTKTVGKSKAEPDVFLKAAEAIGTSPEVTFVFEDVLPNVKTAKKAGFLTAAVFDSDEINQTEMQEVAHVYLPDFTDWSHYF